MVKTDPKKLGKDSWLQAALAELVKAGIDGVRVEVLAKRLGVTKGSFYWHFKDRRALLAAMLEFWEERATAAIIRSVEAGATDPAERLEKLVRATTSGRGDAVEAALRAWSAVDPTAKEAVHRIDTRRERYVAQLFLGMGYSKESAKARTRILYLALIGEFTFTASGSKPTPARVWDELLELVQPS